MLITKERDYAIRAVRALYGMGKRSVKEICDEEGVPFDFAYKVLKKLNRAGIVQSIRGAHGGYRLAKELETISMLDIVLAVDEGLYVSDCLVPGRVCSSPKKQNLCVVHETLGKLQEKIIEELRAVKLSILV